MNWIKITKELPKEGVFFLTKIEDENGTRNQCDLKRQGNLYFLRDGMYVYYTPTHFLKP